MCRCATQGKCSPFPGSAQWPKLHGANWSCTTENGSAAPSSQVRAAWTRDRGSVLLPLSASRHSPCFPVLASQGWSYFWDSGPGVGALRLVHIRVQAYLVQKWRKCTLQCSCDGRRSGQGTCAGLMTGLDCTVSGGIPED